MLWSAVPPPTIQAGKPPAPERMVTSRASTHACEMNCSMVKYFTRCVRPKSSSKVGGATSTQSGRMNRWTTSHQHRKCSCPPSLRGRLRYVDRLRRPRWRNGQLSTNIPPGPLDGGRSQCLRGRLACSSNRTVSRSASVSLLSNDRHVRYSHNCCHNIALQ